MSAGTLRRIAILGNLLPRQCGIATFTAHLSDAIIAERGGGEKRQRKVRRHGPVSLASAVASERAP